SVRFKNLTPCLQLPKIQLSQKSTVSCGTISYFQTAFVPSL
ncbi:hypothetical protein NEIFLAOT_01662, partial [Neisseria flavescens NRL30031/H210]